MNRTVSTSLVLALIASCSSAATTLLRRLCHDSADLTLPLVDACSSAASDTRFRFALLGGSGDWQLTETIRRAAPERCENFAGRTTLPELIEVLRRCELLVTNDTGPMPLAAALRRPVVSLFGPTRPDQTGPYGQTHLALTRPLPCAPCMKSRCHWAEPLACLRGLSPARVADEVVHRLETEF